jgi:hypothetical protein
MPKDRFWVGDVAEKDDFGDPIKDEFIDGRTKSGQWCIMTMKSWRRHSLGNLGLGWGQRYRKIANGQWLKVEG